MVRRYPRDRRSKTWSLPGQRWSQGQCKTLEVYCHRRYDVRMLWIGIIRDLVLAIALAFLAVGALRIIMTEVGWL